MGWDGTFATPEARAQRTLVEARVGELQAAIAASGTAHFNAECIRIGNEYALLLKIHSMKEWRSLSANHPDNIRASELSAEKFVAFQAMNDAARIEQGLQEKLGLCQQWLSGNSTYSLEGLLEATRI